jgi:tetratricopeptide (TPR) repeat protein/cold shock CspA family protein
MDSSIMRSAQELENELKWTEAAAQYVQLLDDSPSVDVYERAAWCFSRAGEYQNAIEYLLKLHELEPLSAKWLYMIGYQYYCQKEWNGAIEWFEKALKCYPDYFIVKYRLAYAYVQTAGIYKKLTKAEYWKAIGHLKDCHKLWDTFDDIKRQKERNTYFDVNFLHGKILMDLPRHYSQAINLFQTALGIKPTDEFAKYNLAKTFYLSGEYQKAQENIPAGNQYYIVELTAYTEAKLGNYQKAISIVDQLLLQRKSDYLYAFLAEVYMLETNPEKAYKAARQALSLGKKNHKNYYVIAKVYYHYGLLDKAVESLELAIKMKQSKYDASYAECDELREKILQEKSSDYKDDPKLIEKLDGLIAAPRFEQSVICRYNSEKGFGFIKGNLKDIFFHVSNCNYRNIAVGDSVRFSTTTTERGLMAVDVRKVD